MGDLGAAETAERELINFPLFIAGYSEAPGVINNDPVTTEVYTTGAREKDADVPVKLQNGAETVAHVRIAAVEEQAANSITAQSAAQHAAPDAFTYGLQQR